MRRLKLAKKFRSTLEGVPGQEVVRLENPETVALLPFKIPFIKPGLLVHEQDLVAIGTPLFHDKRDTRIRFLSPGGGVVEKITFGPRRVVEEIVIRLDAEERQDPSADAILGMGNQSVESLCREDIVKLLMQVGMWQMFRQFPFMDIADDKSSIPMIIVSLQPGDLFSPSAAAILKGQEDFFLCGVALIKQLSEVVVAAPDNLLSLIDGQMPELTRIKREITHITDNLYPAGDPGVILYQIRKESSQNRSVTIHPQDLIAIGELFLTGRFPVKRIYTVAGLLDSGRDPCHLISRQGSPISFLTGEILQSRGVVTGGLFTGSSLPTSSLPDGSHVLNSYSHMGRDDYSAVVVKQSSEDKLFGFLAPGAGKLTESRTFVSAFVRNISEEFSYDMNLHGEERACINCGLCDKKCPVDLLPQFIMKAAQAEEIEEIVSMGLLDCTLCGLCTFVCPSKIDLTRIMELAKNSYYKEMVTR